LGCALGARRLLEKSACFVVCAHPQASVSRAQPPRSIYVVLYYWLFLVLRLEEARDYSENQKIFYKTYRCHTNVLVINNT
jgi:hypothetical protein